MSIYLAFITHVNEGLGKHTERNRQIKNSLTFLEVTWITVKKIDKILSSLLWYFQIIYSDIFSFTFLWIFFLCLSRCLFWLNSLPQLSQENFMPSWIIRLCSFKLRLSLNPFPHSLHMWGFSCKWVPKNKREKDQEL